MLPTRLHDLVSAHARAAGFSAACVGRASTSCACRRRNDPLMMMDMTDHTVHVGAKAHASTIARMHAIRRSVAHIR
jgi:deoxyhypusine synthase